MNSRILAKRWGPYFVQLMREGAAVNQSNGTTEEEDGALSDDGATVTHTVFAGGGGGDGDTSTLRRPSTITTKSPSLGGATIVAANSDDLETRIASSHFYARPP